ncbi:MAG: competence protein ComEC family protein [Clostridiales bacterium]|nr:competence protein ComEC family protein [Clostridiales bacterium]
MKRVFAFIGFSLALTLIILNIIPLSAIKYIALSAVILFILSLLITKTRQAAVLPVVLGSVLFACFIFLFVSYNTVLPQLELDGTSQNVVLQIVDIPQKSDDNYSYVVKTKSVDRDNTVQNFKFKLVSDYKIDADYYDNVNAQVVFYSVADNAFDSYGYYGDSIYLTGYLLDYTVDESTESPPLNYYFIQVRLYIKELMSDMFDDDLYGLSTALLIGDKSNLSQDVQSNFKICGASHLMAVSGLHTSVVCMGLYIILKFLGARPFTRNILPLFALFIYVGLADFSKSVLRAGVMMFIILVGNIINSKADLLNSLGFATFILCFNPFAVTDVSVLLTVSAVLGIAVIFPKLRKLYSVKNFILNGILDSVAVTVSVMLSTLPTMWLFFKNVSLLSILLNIILIPLAQIAMVCCLLLVIFGGIPVLSVCIRAFADLGLKGMLCITEFCAEHFSFAYISLNSEMFGIAIALVLLFIAICILIFKHIDVRQGIAFTLAVFLLVGILNYYNIKNSSYVTITDSGCIIIYDKDNLLVIDADSSDDYYSVKSIASNNNLLVNFYVESDYNKTLLSEFSSEDCLFTDNDNLDIDLCSSINVKYDGNEYIITVYDKYLTADKQFVTVGNTQIYRSANDLFLNTQDTTLIFMDNCEIQMRKDD